jgi:hypothetical protein
MIAILHNMNIKAITDYLIIAKHHGMMTLEIMIVMMVTVTSVAAFLVNQGSLKIFFFPYLININSKFNYLLLFNRYDTGMPPQSNDNYSVPFIESNYNRFPQQTSNTTFSRPGTASSTRMTWSELRHSNNTRNMTRNGIKGPGK